MERRVFNLRRQPGPALISSPRSAGIPRRCRNTFIDCWPQGRSIRFLIVRRSLIPAADLTSLGSLQAPQIPIGNSMFWNSLYVPSLGLEFPSDRLPKNWSNAEAPLALQELGRVWLERL